MKAKQHGTKAFVRRAGFVLLAVFILFLIVFAISNILIASHKGEVYAAASPELPEFRAALVLGTSKSLRGGGPNLYFRYRMDAAAQLYHSGKVGFLFLSGSTSDEYYNEPLDMQRALVQRDVPVSAMIIDEAGNDTFTSIRNIHTRLGIERVIIVTQDFHAERALFLSSAMGYRDAALIADSVSDATRARLEFRELFARVKAAFDLVLYRITNA